MKVVPIIDKHTYLGVKIPWPFSDAHMDEVIGNSMAQIGKVDAILKDSHLDTGIEICFLMNAILPKLENAGQAWEGNANLVQQLEAVQMMAAKRVLGCPRATHNAVFKAEL